MIILTLATFAMVFLRAWQRQNVIHRYYWREAGTSYLIGIADVFVMLNVADHGVAAIPAVGTGGALGVTGAMWLHGRLRG